jgi:hypothetical protein
MFRGSEKGTSYPLYSPVPLHFPSRASPCAITFQLESTIIANCFPALFIVLDLNNNIVFDVEFVKFLTK